MNQNRLDELIKQYKKDLNIEIARDYYCEIILNNHKQSIFIQGFEWSEELKYEDYEMFKIDALEVEKLDYCIEVFSY